MKEVYFGVILMLCSISKLVAQDPIYPDSLIVNFYFLEGKIKDTNQMELTIKFYNAGKSIALIDSVLINGIKYDYWGNIYFEIEKLESGQYRPYHDLAIDYKYGDSAPNVKRNYSALKSGDSAALKYNLFHRTNSVDEGNFRMRAHLLKAPINSPRYSLLIYYSSQWFTYEVVRPLYRKPKGVQ